MQYVQNVSYNCCVDKLKDTSLDVSAARKSIVHAQDLGTWPKKPEPFNKEVTPPFIPQDPLTRTHEQAMGVFHKIEKEYQKDENARKANIQAPPTRTHEQAMETFHKIEKEYQERQSRTHEQVMTAPQIEQTPTPVITEKRNIFKRLFARILGKS